MSNYLILLESGELAHRVEKAHEALHSCRLCGWDCGIDRTQSLGPCRTGSTAHVATAYRHFGEEGPLVGSPPRKGGSGAFFFAYCVLRCQFCQTARWNILGQGHPLGPNHLAAQMLDFQRQGAVNINLVTPIHVLPQILEAIYIAVCNGLRLPLAWNSSGYESPQALELLNGVVDIYLPDMKYSDATLAHRLSTIRDYPRVNRQAVLEMYRQVGHLQIEPDGIARQGLLVRHLVMPGYFENTAGVLHWVVDNLGPLTYLSLMDQYRPAYRASTHTGLNRAITLQEYNQARTLAYQLGLQRLDDNLTLPQEEETHGC